MSTKNAEDCLIDWTYKNAGSLERSFLAHHGILGQKWGIRRFQNMDGSLTEEGKKRYRAGNKEQKQVHDIFSKASYKQDVSSEIFNTIHADKKYLIEAERAVDEYVKVQKEITKEANDLFQELRDEKNIHIYEAASELASSAGDYGRDVDDVTLGFLGENGYFGVLEDGQQSEINAYSMYTYERGLSDVVSEQIEKSYDSTNKARNSAVESISEALREVGAENFAVSPNNTDYTAAKGIVNHMMSNKKYSDGWEATNGSWYLNEASYVADFSENDKQNIVKAKNYVNKINNASDDNTWWYVSEAAENLNMSSTKLKDLSSSDWDRLNKEITELRKNNSK